MGRNWLLVGAAVVFALWLARALVAGWGPGYTLFLTSFGLPIAAVLGLSWVAGRMWNRRGPRNRV